MKMTSKWLENSTESIHYLEGRLAGTLRPIQPNPEFVGRLHKRLVNNPAVMMERTPDQRAYLTIAAGLCVGALLIWLLQRLR